MRHLAARQIVMVARMTDKICSLKGTPCRLSMSGRMPNGTLERRGGLVEQALRLEWLTAAWMLIEAAVAIGSGIMAHSLTLIAFGADSVIELLSALLLLWRLTVELRRGEDFPEELEERAAKIGAALLLALSLT
jgi:hypothetical protein